MIKPIKKVLIANRAEIALRIMRSCKERGISTVSVYTQGEEQLPHVLQADLAVCLQGTELSETYLNIDQIIQTALNHQCDAIHPGYGFLSENAVFARKVKTAGLRFIGPSAEVIELMGDKKRARSVAEKAGVPLVPGFSPAGMPAEDIQLKAQQIGFPVMIKATAGGGGKGMRIVHEPNQLQSAIKQAAAEAKSAFGHDEVLVEKYLVEPRHIEVQVLGDHHQQYFHLFERDCSVQRRHQKVIEESPAVGLNEQTYKTLFNTAIALCKEVNYTNAGTIEFIMDRDQKVYFLEMNTRLQVEHPVTEAVTGLDLVSLQIDVAEGIKLAIEQHSIPKMGHAIELRLYAEDPVQQFMPTSGVLHHFEFPKWPGVRVDTGYTQSLEVSNRFDPMIAKIIVKAESRKACMNRARSYLQAIRVGGFVTNLGLLQRILSEEDFLKGGVSTHYLQEHKDLLQWAELAEEDALFSIAAALFHGVSGKSAGSTQADNSMPFMLPTDLEEFRNV